MNIFSIADSVKQAFDNSENQELKAELYLSIYRKNKISNNYAKTIKAISKISKRVTKLNEKGYSDEDPKINELIKKMETEYEKKEEYILQAEKLDNEVNNADLISKRLISRYRQGLLIEDVVKKVVSANSSYGRMIYEVFAKMSSGSLVDNLKRVVGKGKPTYLQDIMTNNPNLKKKSFLDSEQGALLLESHFILFLLHLYTKDLSEEQLRQLLNEIIAETGKGDLELTKKLKELYKGGSLARQFSAIILQIIRLSVGKGVFMNSAVKITNIILRAVVGKGMTYARNAVFRKFLARFLGSGPYAVVINIFLFIPDVASIFHRRDYVGVVSSIMLLYFLRNDNATA